MGLREGILTSNWNGISGGERQRAAIACAIILATSVDSIEVESQDGEIKMRQPNAILLLDEPTAACDSESCALVEKVLVVSGLTMLLITHDDKQAGRLAHRRVKFHLEQSDSPLP